MRNLLHRGLPGVLHGRGGDDKAASDDMWVRCGKCRELVYRREWDSNAKVCPKCGFHERLTARERIDALLDPGSFQELDAGMRSSDPLEWAPPTLRSYREKLVAEEESSGVTEAALYGRATLGEIPIVYAALEWSFFLGTFSAVVGEKITRAFELAAKERRPIVICSASAGARQQEGVVALLQMAKMVAAANRLAAARMPYISILTNQTLGGVTASYATVADCLIAEPGAVLGFAGPRVVEQTIGEKLPPGAQTSEFQLQHGMVDLVVPRRELRDAVARVIRFYQDAVERAERVNRGERAAEPEHELAMAAAG